MYLYVLSLIERNAIFRNNFNCSQASPFRGYVQNDQLRGVVWLGPRSTSSPPSALVLAGCPITAFLVLVS